jgi:hypothetical protein
MIQTFHPLDPPTGDEFHQAARILRRDHGAENADRRAIMICLYRGSETRWPSAEFVNQDPLGMGRAEWTHEWLTEFPHHG